MKKKKPVVNIALSGMFLALAYVMPFFTGQIREIGVMLCPMHIPVLLCGFICGAPYGMAVGVIVPLLRSFTLGSPTLFPSATAMAFELAAYGFTAGILYKILPKTRLSIYISLLSAMFVGRAVWGLAMFCILGFDVTKFGFAAFWTGAVANSLPAIIIQIILIPIIIILLEKAQRSSEKE